MKPLRYGLLALSLLLGGIATADARVGVSLHLSVLPELVPVPDYPVYYAPAISANFFFYDGAYWLYEEGHWYTSDWYNGPWAHVDPLFVPDFILRVPVRYYRAPPPVFRLWVVHAPPRWGHYWGHAWERRRHGWDRWDHRHVPVRAPLPHYQRHYGGNRYPRADRQRELRSQHYPHRPRERAVQQRQREWSPPRQHERPHGGQRQEVKERHRPAQEHRQRQRGDEASRRDGDRPRQRAEHAPQQYRERVQQRERPRVQERQHQSRQEGPRRDQGRGQGRQMHRGGERNR